MARARARSLPRRDLRRRAAAGPRETRIPSRRSRAYEPSGSCALRRSPVPEIEDLGGPRRLSLRLLLAQPLRPAKDVRQRVTLGRQTVEQRVTSTLASRSVSVVVAGHALQRHARLPSSRAPGRGAGRLHERIRPSTRSRDTDSVSSVSPRDGSVRSSRPASSTTTASQRARRRPSVRRDHDADAELTADAADRSTCRVDPSDRARRRLVEEGRTGSWTSAWSSLTPLLHARRVRTHRAVAFLEETDVAEHVGRAQARPVRGKPRSRPCTRGTPPPTPARGKTVVLRRLADPRAVPGEPRVSAPSTSRPTPHPGL